MLRELPLWSLLDSPAQARVVLANFEDSKFVFQLPDEGSVVVVSDREGERQQHVYAPGERRFLRVSSDATTLIFESPAKSSLLDSVTRIFRKDPKHKTHRFDLLNVARLEWTSVWVAQKIADVAERTPGIYLLLTEQAEFWEFEAALGTIREVAQLTFKPSKIFCMGGEVVFASEEQLQKFGGRPETLRGKLVLRNRMETCFRVKDLLVCLSSSDGKFYLETVDLAAMRTHSHHSLASPKDSTVDLYMGVVPLIDRATGKSEPAVLVTYSHLSTDSQQPHKTIFEFHRLSDLRPLGSLPTHYAVENRNLFLAGAWLGDSPGLNGVIANYGHSPDNLPEIQRLTEKKTQQTHRAALFLTFAEDKVTFPLFFAWSEYLGVPLQVGTELRFRESTSHAGRLRQEVLPVLEGVLEGPAAGRLRNLLFARGENGLLFEDEGDFFEFGLRGLTAKLTADFPQAEELSTLLSLHSKTDNLLQLAVAYLENRRLFVQGATEADKQHPMDPKLEEFLQEVETLVRRVRQLQSLVRMRLFFEGVENTDGGVHLASGDLFVHFRKLNEDYSESASKPPSSALKLLLEASRAKRRTVDELEGLPPTSLLQVLWDVARCPRGLDSPGAVASFLSRPATDFETKVLTLLYYFLAAGLDKTSASFVEECEVPGALLSQAKAFLALDQACVAKGVQLKQPSVCPETEAEFKEAVHRFLLHFKPEIGPRAVVKQALVNLSLMEAGWAVGALFADPFDWVQRVGFELASEVLVLSNRQNQLVQLLLRAPHATEKQLERLANFVRRSGFKPSAGLTNKLGKSKNWKAMWDPEGCPETERELREHLAEGKWEEAAALAEKSPDSREWGLESRFLARVTTDAVREGRAERPSNKDAE